MAKLSAIQIRNTKAKDKPYKLSDGYGLYFHVATSGKRTWRYRFRINGKESTFTLGEYPQMSLEQARGTRTKVREQVQAGTNPGKARREKIQAIQAEEQKAKNIGKTTFEFVALEWVELQRDRWSQDHANAVLATLTRDAFPVLGSHQIDTITPPLVLQVIRKIEKRGSLSYWLAAKPYPVITYS